MSEHLFDLGIFSVNLSKLLPDPDGREGAFRPHEDYKVMQALGKISSRLDYLMQFKARSPSYQPAWLFWKDINFYMLILLRQLDLGPFHPDDLLNFLKQQDWFDEDTYRAQL